MEDDSLNTSEPSTISDTSRVSVIETRFTNESTLDFDSAEGTVYAIFVSFAEIYNEYIYDLLEKMPTSKKNRRIPLVLGEDRNSANYIKGLLEIRVRSAEEAWKLLEIGRQNLHFAATRLNHNSSRSHCIFTIKMVRLANAEDPHVARVSMLSVCDLAGAERAAKTQSNHDRLKEAGNINTSLLVLSRCIDALRRNQIQKGSKKREIPVPYRDSKLTRLFQNFFLGRGKSAMIVNIAKTPLLFDETIQVLKFSALAKQVAISQTKEPECKVNQVKVPKRTSHFGKFIRQSLTSNGRMSVPWAKDVGDVTFGEESKIEEEEENPMETVEEEAEEDERYEALVELISKLRDELLKEHKEKVEIETRTRDELCTEFSQQLVEIESNWSQRLKNQQARSEELNDWRINALMKSTKKTNSRKRFRPEDDPDDEYVSSINLHQEEVKVKELNAYVGELETEKKHILDECTALKTSQKKTSELATKYQEENSKLTFQLAQLTTNYDKINNELEESKKVRLSMTTETLVVEELKRRMDQSKTAIASKDEEIMEIKEMLTEAAEEYLAKQQECIDLAKAIEKSENTVTKQLVNINELENQVAEARAIITQYAAQLEERDQHSAELREQLESKENVGSLMAEVSSQHNVIQGHQNKIRVLVKKLTEKEQQYEESQKKLKLAVNQKQKLEEDNLRDKSKLLLELAGLKRNGLHNTPHSLEEDLEMQMKVSKLEAQVEDDSKEKQHLSNQLTESKEMFAHLQSANRTLEVDNQEMKRENENLKMNVEEVSNKIVSLQDERAAEQLEISALKATSGEEYEEQLQERDQKIRTLEGQVAEVEQSKDSLAKEVERMSADIAALQQDNESKLMFTEELFTLKEQLNQKSGELEVVQGEKEHFMKAIDEYKNEIENKNVCIQNIEDKNTTAMDELRSEIAEQVSKISVLETQQDLQLDLERKSEGELKSKEILEEQLTQKCNEIEVLTKERETLQTKVDECKAELENKDTCNKDMQEKNVTTMEKLQEDIAVKDSTILELERERDLAHSHEDHLKANLQGKIDEELRSQERLKTRIETLEAEILDQKSQNQEVLDMKHGLEAELNMRSEKIDELIQEIKGLKEGINCKESKTNSDLEKLQAEFTELTQENGKLEELLKQQQGQSTDSQKQFNQEKEELVHELATQQQVCQELESNKSTLEQTLYELSTLKDEHKELQGQLEKVEQEKCLIKEKLLNHENNANHRDKEREQEEQMTKLVQEMSEIKINWRNTEEVSRSLKKNLQDKEDVIAALNAKVESLDSKLNVAEDELEDRKQQFSQDIRSATSKCDVLEKEARAVREARQEEISLSTNQREEEEQQKQQKDEEIKSLQQEVKKLLQQSMSSSQSNTSHITIPDTPKVKKESIEADEDILALKEQFKQSEVQKEFLIQEITGLKTQLQQVRESMDSSCALTINSTKKSDVGNVSQSDCDSIKTPIGKGRGRGRKKLPTQTPSESLHLHLDTTDGDNSPTGNLQRRSRRVKTKKQDTSFEYADNWKAPREREEEDDDWQPIVPTTKPPPMPTAKPRTTRTKKPKKQSQVYNPHVDQENKSSIANKATDAEVVDNEEAKTPSRQRRRRPLYSNVEEPYQCSPNVIDLPPVEDSPHSVVRRQLRNKKK